MDAPDPVFDGPPAGHRPGAVRTGTITSLIDGLKTNPDQRQVQRLLVELVNPKNVPLRWQTVLPALLLGGLAAMLVYWAGWVMVRWWAIPADVRRLVLADRSARRRIALGLVSGVVAIAIATLLTLALFLGSLR